MNNVSKIRENRDTSAEDFKATDAELGATEKIRKRS